MSNYDNWKTTNPDYFEDEIEEWECESCGEVCEDMNDGSFVCGNDDCDMFGNIITKKDAEDILSEKAEAVYDAYVNAKIDESRGK